jgi:hypothetical protein
VCFEQRAGVDLVGGVGQKLDDLRVDANRECRDERGPIGVQEIDPTGAHSGRG